MFFNSFHFAAFISIVCPIALSLRRHVAARNSFLLIASYYFYACWDWRFLSLIWISTAVDYYCGLKLNTEEITEGSRERSRRDRLYLTLSVIVNLAILGVFKYYNFFIENAVQFLGHLGFSASAPSLQVILPVGISFYTFQTLSYTIDCYRGKVITERNFLNFALFVAFFPQLVAGPIERARKLLPQIQQQTAISLQAIYTGAYLILWGLFKKVVLADNMAQLADLVFAAEDPSGCMVMLGLYAFAIQIYCDFSGYTDIARGTARCMGFDLMLNFKLPYFAVNPSDFWRRWHISLSSWLRDYLYIPLGGNRFGSKRTYFNLMATMVLGGIWHGAAWTFVFWGVFHGLMLCVHRALRPLLNKFLPTDRGHVSLWYWIRVVAFFQLTCFGWLLFRAESMEQVGQMLMSLVTNATLDLGEVPGTMLLGFGCACVGLAAMQLLQFLRDDLDALSHLASPVRGAVFALMLLGLVCFGVPHGEAFIYFAF